MILFIDQKPTHESEWLGEGSVAFFKDGIFRKGLGFTVWVFPLCERKRVYFDIN